MPFVSFVDRTRRRRLVEVGRAFGESGNHDVPAETVQETSEVRFEKCRPVQRPGKAVREFRDRRTVVQQTRSDHLARNVAGRRRGESIGRLDSLLSANRHQVRKRMARQVPQILCTRQSVC